MSKHRLTIKQVIREAWEIELEVEAPTLAEAIEKQQKASLPPHDDKRWLHDSTPESEVVTGSMFAGESLVKPKHVAFGRGAGVSLVADILDRATPDGMYFRAINGGWTGHFKEGKITVEGGHGTFDVEKLWEGDLPDILDRHAMLPWVEEQLRK